MRSSIGLSLFKARWLCLAAIASALLLSACGSGGRGPGGSLPASASIFGAGNLPITAWAFGPGRFRITKQEWGPGAGGGTFELETPSCEGKEVTLARNEAQSCTATVKVPATGFTAGGNKALVTKWTLNGGRENPENTWIHMR